MKNLYEIRGDVTEIYLNKSDGTIISTIIDTVDFETVNKIDGRWYPIGNESRIYVAYSKKFGVGRGKVKSISMHRLIMNARKNFHIDHINHDTLNNRKSNLREVTCSENLQNRKGLPSNNKSGIRGVSWSKFRGEWVVQIGVKGKTIHIGFFKDIKDAEKAAIASRKMYMPFSKEA